MAKLLDGTRIYGTANVDTQVNVGANVVINTSVVFVGNSSVNVSVNSTIFSGTANNANYIKANNGIISNATGVYVNGNNGLITNSTGVHVRSNNGIIANSTGTFVNGNTGLVVNSTGVFVNATYINTISSNSSTYANSSVSNTFTVGTSAYFVSNGNFGVGTSSPDARFAVSGTANISGNVAIAGITTLSANLILGSSGLSSNGSFGTAGHVLHSNGTATYWAADDNSGGTVTSVATGNGLTGGTISTTGTVSVLANNGIVANSTGTFVNANNGLISNATGVFVNSNNGIVANSTGVFVNANSGLVVNSTGVFVNPNNGIIANSTGVFVNANTGLVVNSTGLFVNSTYINTISSNSATYANSSVSNTFTVGTAAYFVTNGNFGIANSVPVHKLRVDGTISLSGGIHANGSLGSDGQVLTSNGSVAYWATASGGGSLSTYSANVGNGTSNSFTITHNLNSNSLLFTTREISTGYIVYPDIKQTTTNACLLEFASNPTANQYVILVVKVA